MKLKEYLETRGDSSNPFDLDDALAALDHHIFRHLKIKLNERRHRQTAILAGGCREGDAGEEREEENGEACEFHFLLNDVEIVGRVGFMGTTSVISDQYISATPSSNASMLGYSPIFGAVSPCHPFEVSVQIGLESMEKRIGNDIDLIVRGDEIATLKYYKGIVKGSQKLSEKNRATLTERIYKIASKMRLPKTEM